MTSQSDHNPLPLGDSQVNVPTFGCVVYVSKLANGQTLARVANLSGLTATAASEREAFAKLVPSFKQFVRDKLEAGESIPWIDPLPELAVAEQRRFLPVHL